ncbi:MAG: acyl-CoA synthetase [Pseudomonadota bacterium]
MHPRKVLETTPSKLAVILGQSGQALSYLELEQRANQAAHLFRAAGITKGDRVAFALENCLDLFVFVWAAQRSGVYYVAISSRLKSDEIEYIVRDSGAKFLLVSDYLGNDTIASLTPSISADVELYKLGESAPGWRDWSAHLTAQPMTPIEDEGKGADMLYSSGTTGRPKGIFREIDHNRAADAEDPSTRFVVETFKVDDQAVYLCPAPLYHAAPLRWSMEVQKLGGTVVVMERFDPENALSLIQDYRVTHAQFVPTHFVRMLKLDESVRSRYDTTSLQMALHAAAPCPKQIKKAMIEWCGPILVEYYSGSENVGMTMITSQEWLAHEGSVGRAVRGEVKILAPSGKEVPFGEEGEIFFANGGTFKYHNDPQKTEEATNSKGWSTLGDVGRLDEEGYLYLTDRKSFMIISGGVNIYPQEIENLLITHDKVYDVAVIGAPDPDFGEKVVAVVQPMNWDDDTQSLTEELIGFCKTSLSGVKVPRQIDFVESLPRADNGKLYKRQVRDRYWKTQEPANQSL